MDFKKKVITTISEKIYRNNIILCYDCEFYLSHVRDKYFCIFTRKPMGNLFDKKCNSNLNSFFKKLGCMLLSDNINGEGCFDYENKSNNFKIKRDLLNNYFNCPLNLILIRFSVNKIKPISFFSLDKGFLWNVCTNIDERNKGYMNLLFNHFLKLIKRNDIKDMLIKNKVELYLLKINPNFDKIKSLYEDFGFKLKKELEDKSIMELEFIK